MADMIILVPSRGRPDNVRRLADACAKTCRADTRLWFGFDDDDPQLNASLNTAGFYGAKPVIRPRMGLAPWTNELAALALKEHPEAAALCSLGDDHVPVTDGWDAELVEALDQIGGGWAYPDDARREDIAEAVAVSSEIVKGLGWMALPDLHHWCIDNAWTKLAATVGRLEFLHYVKVPHYHPHSPVPAYQVPADPVYEEARWSYDLDKRRYLHWRDQGGLAKDAAKVREILGMETGVKPHCGAQWPNLGPAGDLWTCTLDRGHDGDHEAWISHDRRANDRSAVISQDDEAVIW